MLVFARNQTTDHSAGAKSGVIASIGCHPPRNNVTAMDEIVTMCMYSAMKNIRNLIPEYSV